MKSGLKRSAQSPPAPSPCAAPERLSFANCRNSLSTLNPASRGALASFATSVPRRYGPMPAWRFWLTFKVILISSESGGETCSDLIFWCIGARRGRKIGGGGIGGGLDLNTCSDQGFTEHRFCELCGRRYGY